MGRIIKAKRPFGAYVVADPVSVFSPSAISVPFRGIFQQLFDRQVRKACQHATAAGYVANQLVSLYPPKRDANPFVFSDVRLHNAFLSGSGLDKRLANLKRTQRPLRVGTIASLARPYKGIDVLLNSLASLKDRLEFTLSVAGDGILKAELREQAHRLGIGGQVNLLGRVPAGKAIFEFLDDVDLYVQPSRTEGLPRALIEAMARGCPAIGTRVGGIPELLADSELVPTEDSTSLAEKIAELAADKERMVRLVGANIAIARQYDASRIDGTRLEFLQAVRKGSSPIAHKAACACAE
jgi:glycosyltransferase involved in cell wall biosynthesis